MDATPIQIAGRTIDLATLAPLTIGDKIQFKNDTGLHLSDMKSFDEEQEAKLIFFILNRHDKNIVYDDVLALHVLTGRAVINAFFEVSAEVDKPFLTQSTSSQNTTDGAAKTSPDSPTPS